MGASQLTWNIQNAYKGAWLHAEWDVLKQLPFLRTLVVTSLILQANHAL